jgi:hypothetical protein
MKKYILIAALFLASIGIKAQTIDLKFPYFAGQTYEFKIFQGEKQITLTTGTLRKGGKVRLSIPKEYAGYKGFFNFSVTIAGLRAKNFSVNFADSADL